MNKRISFKFLRLCTFLALTFFSTNLFSQNVDVYFQVNWVNYSGENKIELINDSNSVVLSIEDNYGNGSNTSFLNQNSNTVSIPPGNYTIRRYDNYGDDWNGTGSFAKLFVNNNEVYNFDGNFTNNGPANVEISQDDPITITTPDDASFSYSQSSYCPESDSNPTPTITGETGGTFSSTSGLNINSSTGEIDLANSTDGTYQVTYTTTNPGQNSSQVSVTIGDAATFEYTTSSATQSDTDLSPTTTGASGTYSSTTGLSINTATGVIDVSASTPGTYCVTYTTNGSCPSVLTDDVTITATNFPGVAIYNNANNDFPNNATNEYIQYIPGNMPVIIAAPHGGKKAGSGLPTRSCGTNEEDNNTDILIKEIQKLCYEQYGLYPYIIVNDLSRSKLDPNRVKSIATCNNAAAGEYYDAFHGFIDEASAEVTANYGKGLFIDLHGQSHSIPRIEAGYNLESSAYDNNLNTAANLQKVTIKNLIENNIQNIGFDDMVRGSQSLGGLFQVTGGSEYAALGHAGCSRTVGYRTVPSHIITGSSEGSCDDTNPGGNSYFAGDFYNNIRHGSGDPTFSNPVVQQGSEPNVPGGGGTIDGIMTEVNRRVRDLGNTYAGAPYNRTDSRSATLPFFARDYGTVIKDFIDLHYNDFSEFSYANSTYDLSDASNPTPTITGISGGTFTPSGSGLVINSSTGEINLASSTAGVYTITYLAPNIESYYKKVINITLTENPDDATFSYSASSFCKNVTNPTPSITGENGGTFSAPSGLEFVDNSTGQIDLVTSTAGTYTITYTTNSPGQNSSTFEVTIVDLDNASFSYSAASYPISDPNQTPTLVGLSGGVFTSEPAGLDLNSATGEITLINSSTGNYVVTYTVTGSCNTIVTTQNVSVTGSVLDVSDEEINVFSLFPNPTSDVVKIESNKDITKVIIHDLIGRKLKVINNINQNKEVDLSSFKKDTYLLTFYNEDKKLGTRTIIKN